jgi:uncharacterized membrane protein YkgB
MSIEDWLQLKKCRYNNVFVTKLFDGHKNLSYLYENKVYEHTISCKEIMSPKNDNFFYISVLHWQASLLGPVSN